MNIQRSAIYAPTNDMTDETKEESYTQLHHSMSNLRDTIINLMIDPWGIQMELLDRQPRI